MNHNLFTTNCPGIEQLLRAKTKLFCLLACIFLFQVASFAQTADILITPASSTITIGQSFTVNVRVDMQSSSCNAAEVHLNFNTAYLQITNITRPSSATFSSETISLPAAPYTTANSTGHLEYAAGIVSGSTSADFDILAITFSTPLSSPQAGTTSITLQNSPGHRTRTALNGIPLSGTLTDGTADIQNCTAPTGTIAGFASSTTCNAQPLGLNLSAATGVSPYDLVVNGVTYPDVTVGSTFATIPFPTYNIWPSTDPGLPRQGNGMAIEVGTKFSSSQAGFISGLRFYNGSGSYTLGAYKGKLWNFNTGALLATITYTGVSTGQWVEVMFPTPLAIAANTTYLVSVYSSVGNYVATNNFFATSVTNGPLTALANSTSSNGIFFSGSEQSGPTTNFGNWQTYLSSNYWTDVIFAQNTNSFNLTSITDATGCNSTGALQTLNATSVNCGTLPVTLLSFFASLNGRNVTLHWSTSTELNNRGFDIQRSNDAVNWTSIGFVAGAGNSDFVKNYTYPDNNLETRRYYYRLNQTNIDGHSKYSAIVSAVIGGKEEYTLEQNYPNPSRNETTIQYSLPKPEQVNISLFDITGRTVKVLVNASREAGTHAISFNTGTLTKGIYYYKIQAGDFTDVKKMTVQ